MWNYIANKTTILIVLICILTVFVVIQWYETKKLRHKFTKIDKQIQSLGKNQVHLDKLITKSFAQVPLQLPPTQRIPTPRVSQRVPPSQTPQVSRISQVTPQVSRISKPKSPSPQQIFVISETLEIPKQREETESKIVEIEDSEVSSSSDDEEETRTDDEFNEKTLDLELQNELDELK